MTERLITVNIAGVKLKLWRTEQSTYVVDCAAENKWKRPMFKLWNRLLSAGDRVIDAGAYIGTTSLFPAALGCDVIAVEPDPVAYRHLMRNVSENDVPGSVVAVAKILSDINGVTVLRQWREWGDSMASCALEPNTGKLPIRVESITLAQLMVQNSWNSVDMLKINVQGVENAVLFSSEGVIRRHRPIIDCYYYPKLYEHPVRRLETLRDLLSEYEHFVTHDGAPLDWGDALDAASNGTRDGHIVALPKPLSEYGGGQ